MIDDLPHPGSEFKRSVCLFDYFLPLRIRHSWSRKCKGHVVIQERVAKQRGTGILPVIPRGVTQEITCFSRARCRSAELRPKPVPLLTTSISQLPLHPHRFPRIILHTAQECGFVFASRRRLIRYWRIQREPGRRKTPPGAGRGNSRGAQTYHRAFMNKVQELLWSGTRLTRL